MVSTTSTMTHQTSGSDQPIKNVNRLTYHPHKQVLDLGGSAALPFLRHILAADVVKLTTPGMGLQTTLRAADANFDVTLDVYYFSEFAYRIILDMAQPERFSTWLEQHEANFDIDIISRADLAVMLIVGDNAAQVLADQLKFTPHGQLPDTELRFSVQTDQVFVTGNDAEQGYELLASTDELARWQQAFSKSGFLVN